MSDPNQPAFPPPPYEPPPPHQPPAAEPPAAAGWGQGGYGPPLPPPPYQPERPRRSKLPLVLALVVALVLVAGGVTLYVVGSGDDDDPASKETTAATGGPSSGGVTTPEPGDDLSAVVEYDDLEPDHTEDPVDYPQSPPVGGAHYPAWAECGVYDEPLPNEVAVHDLEHGTFWFAYDADALDDDAVAALADQLPDNGIMSPYDGLTAPVVITVWGRQLALTGADDPRIGLFLEEYAGGVTAPEAFASCAGGMTGDEIDGVAEQLGGGSGTTA